MPPTRQDPPGARPASSPDLSSRWESERAFRAMLWTFAGVLLVYSAVPIANALLGESIKDNAVWFAAGQHVVRGEQIYPERGQQFPFMYPPTAALLLAPVSLLGQTGLVVALVVLNLLAWIASILLAVRLASGTWQRQPLLVYALPNLFISVYAWSNFHLAQPSLLLLALMLGAFVLLQGRHRAWAGSLFALAAAIKAFPFLAIFYLIVRRQWLATAALLLTLAFLLLALPTPFRGFAQARTDLQRWTQGMLFKYDDQGVAQRPGRSHSWRNQSLVGVANRLLRPVDADADIAPHRPIYVNLANLSFTAVNGIILAAALALGLLFLGVMPRRAHRTSETDALEAALFLLLLLLFTPLSFGYLFAILMFPFTVIVWRLLRRPNPRLLTCLIASVLLLALTIPFQKMAQAYGNTALATIILFAALAWELQSSRRPPSSGVLK